MKSKTLLCVDDDASIRDLYHIMLGSFGYRVLLAENANNALEVYNSEQDNIDAVILDYQMPGLNGLELAAHLRRRDAFLPIVLISGSNPEAESRPDLIDLALPKGVSLEELLAKLEFLLHRAETATLAASTSANSVTSTISLSQRA